MILCNLGRIFERITKVDLKLASKKAHLGLHVIAFWSHRVTGKGVEPDPDKVEAMTKLPTSNVSQLSYDHYWQLYRTTGKVCHIWQQLRDP